MGRIGLGPYLVGSIGSRVRVRVSFQIYALRMLLIRFLAFREMPMPPFVAEKHTTVEKSDKNLGNRGNNH